MKPVVALLDAPPRWLLWVTGLVGLSVGLAALWLLLGSESVDGGLAFVTIALLIGWSFVGAGLVAWRQRPESRIGLLMVGVGLAWATSAISLSDQPIVYLIGIVVANVWTVLLFQLLLTFPEGRFKSRSERILVAAAWISGVLLQLLAMLFLSLPDPDLCQNCASNPIQIVDSPDAANLMLVLQALIAVPTMLGLLVLLIRRWQGASDAQRGPFVPVLWAGGVVMALLALQITGIAFDLNGAVTDAIAPLMLIAFLTVPFAFLTGLLRTHLSRDQAVSRLLAKLRELSIEGGELKVLLAEALGDPTLSVGYWFPPISGYVDHDGRPLDLEREATDRFVSVVERGERHVAVLICDPALASQTQLVDAVGAAAALALENERLEAELRARVADLSASRIRIVEGSDLVRRRLERDLHDGAQQQLVASALSLKLARNKLKSDPQAVEQLLEQAAADLDLATTELRELARGIHPAVLSDRGLGAGLQALADRAPLPVEIRELPDRRFPDRVEAAAYFVVAEALTNVARYAAAGRATVAVTNSNGQLKVEVADDGKGGANPADGTGLSGLADRVAALDGQLAVDSPLGGGTTVEAVIPCGS